MRYAEDVRTANASPSRPLCILAVSLCPSPIFLRLETQRLHPRSAPAVAQQLSQPLEFFLKVVRARLPLVRLRDRVVYPGQRVVGLGRDVCIDRLVQEFNLERGLWISREACGRTVNMPPVPNLGIC